MKIRKLLCLMTALLCLTSCAVAEPAQQATQAPADATAAMPESTQAPDGVAEISQFTKLDLEPYRGKAIYLNFLTEWCPYCMQELPDIKRIFDEYSPDELQIILVHVWDGEDASATARITKDYGLQDMTFFEDEDRMLSAYIGLQGYPASVFIGKDGVPFGGFNSATNYEQLVKYMEALGVSKK